MILTILFQFLASLQYNVGTKVFIQLDYQNLEKYSVFVSVLYTIFHLWGIRDFTYLHVSRPLC